MLPIISNITKRNADRSYAYVFILHTSSMRGCNFLRSSSLRCPRLQGTLYDLSRALCSTRVHCQDVRPGTRSAIESSRCTHFKSNRESCEASLKIQSNTDAVGSLPELVLAYFYDDIRRHLPCRYSLQLLWDIDDIPPKLRASSSCRKLEQCK